MSLTPSSAPGDSAGQGSYPPPPPPDESRTGAGDGGEPPYQRPSTVRRGAKVVVLAVVLAVLVAGSAVAFYKTDPFHLFRAGPQAAVAIPSGALFYAGVDLNPAAKQKVNALLFLRHFPDLADKSGLQDENVDLRRVFVTNHSVRQVCPGLTYDGDFKPWLGDKFGVAGMPGASAGAAPNVVIAVQIINKAKAEEFLDTLRTCKATVPTFGAAFVDNYLLLAQTQQLADRYADAAQQSSLADNTDYTSDISALGDPGVATFWVNIKGSLSAFGGISAANRNRLDTVIRAYQRAAGTFRFESGYAELAVSVYGDTQSVSHDPNQIVDLPDTTVFAVSESGAGQRVERFWQQTMTQAKIEGVDVQGQLAQIEQQTGLRFPQDLKTLLGKNILFALDSRGLSVDNLQSDPSSVDLGVRFTNDPTALESIYQRVLALLQDQLGGQTPWVKQTFPDGMAIASNAEYAARMGRLDGNLGNTPAFKSVFDNAEGQELAVFFNFDAIEEQVLSSLRDSGASQETLDDLRPLQAVGLSEGVSGHYTQWDLRVSVNQ